MDQADNIISAVSEAGQTKYSTDISESVSLSRIKELGVKLGIMNNNTSRAPCRWSASKEQCNQLLYNEVGTEEEF